MHSTRPNQRNLCSFISAVSEWPSVLPRTSLCTYSFITGSDQPMCAKILIQRLSNISSCLASNTRGSYV
jgi:hypothetical protein